MFRTRSQVLLKHCDGSLVALQTCPKMSDEADGPVGSGLDTEPLSPAAKAATSYTNDLRVDSVARPASSNSRSQVTVLYSSQQDAERV